MQDKFIEFCNDDEVRHALCNILNDRVEEWFHSSRSVVMGIDNSWVARKRKFVEAARVLGMIDLVYSITGLVPEDIVSINPEKYRDLIMYVANTNNK